jgi:beta-glucosidase
VIGLVWAASMLRAQTALTNDLINRRVEELLRKLTLEEKIDLLGGVDGFYVRAIPHIGLPRLKIAKARALTAPLAFPLARMS